MTNATTGEMVHLYVYDLSQGMASILSPSLLDGRVIEGIWHTSVVLYGKEVYFGQGIAIESPPASTHHGKPIEIIPMGCTNLSEEVFFEYIESIRPAWTAEKYHLLDNNCSKCDSAHD